MPHHMVVHHGTHKQSCVQQESMHSGVSGLLHVAWLSHKLLKNCVYTTQGDLGWVQILGTKQDGVMDTYILPYFSVFYTDLFGEGPVFKPLSLDMIR